MGKFNNSDIHGKYSDWHWYLTKKDQKYRRLYVSDIDRLWIEYSFKKSEIVGIFDIKYEHSEGSKIDAYTATEKGIYEWFEKNNAKVYIVYIDREFTRFRVRRFVNNKEKIFSSDEYANWLLSLRNENDTYYGQDRIKISQLTLNFEYE